MTQKVGADGLIANVAMEIAAGVNSAGRRQALHVGVHASEHRAFWPAFRILLKARRWGCSVEPSPDNAVGMHALKPRLLACAEIASMRHDPKVVFSPLLL